jgi:predicted TIM-barrel fold metal-dependent hydrolase
MGNPLLLEELLNRHPTLRVYVMHAGWPFIEETLAMLDLYPQLHVEVGVINWIYPRPQFHAYFKRLFEAGFGDRVMFGSDQMVWPEAIGMAIEGIESAEFLTADQKRDLFYNNAAKFLRLPSAAIGTHGGR